MSENKLRRRGSSRSSRRRRRRRSTHSMTSSYGGMDEDDEMLKMFDNDEDEDDIEINNNHNDDEGDDDENNGDGEKDRIAEELDARRRKLEEALKEEMLLQKIEQCKSLIESVKQQKWKMSRKMKVLSKARSYVEKHEGKLSRSKGYQQRGKQLMKQAMRWWNNVMASLVPWEMRIKRIESHFGSVVASYFIFLRWLLWISVWLAVIPSCFIMIPEMVLGSAHGTTNRKTIPADKEKTAYDLKTIWNAEGVVEYSLLFYGYYGNDGIIGQGYRMPLAYLLTSLTTFAFSFIVVLKRMANNSRQSRLSNKDEQFTFSWKLLTEWDFMIANQETATTKHASITTTFKETILEEQEKAREGKVWLLRSLRVAANVIILLLLALSTYVIQLFVERSREMELKVRNDPNYEAGFWAENELTVIMTLISTIFPNILDLISLMEKYHPRTSLRLMLGRIFALNLLNLYTLFIALYNKREDLLSTLEQSASNQTSVNCTSLANSTVTVVNLTVLSTSKNDTLPGNTQTSDVTGSKTNSDLNLTSQAGCTEQAKSSSSAGLCWETMIGQEVVKLTIMDTVFVIGQIIIIDVVRTFFIKYCNKLCCWDLEKTFPEYPDFKTAENLLHLIGNQGVIWLGAFFAPGLPVLNLLKLLLLVYVRCWSVMMFNAPQQRIFRASRSNNFYYALLLIMLFLCMLPPLFAIVGMEPSPDCGPFSGQEKMYNILTTTMEKELPSVINSVLTYAASPGVILPLFMLLGMTIYYLIAVSRSLQDANNELRMQLEYERTEGRRKVYAMADARHEAKENAKPRGWAAAKAKFVGSSGDSKVANTALSLLEMVKSKKPAAKGLDGFKDLATRGASQQDKSKKTAQAVVNRMKSSKGPAVPVAVIRGKQSIKAKERSRQNAKVPFKDLILDYSRKQQKEDAQPNDEKTKGQRGKKGRGNRGPKKEASKGRYRQRREKSHNRRRVSNSSDDDPDDDDNSDDQSSEEDIVQVHRSRSSGTNSSDNDHHGDDDTNGDRDNKGRRSRNLRDAMKSHNSQLDNKVTKEGSVPSGNSRDRGAPSNGNGRDRTKQNVPSHSRSRGNVGNSESGSEDPEENSPKQKRIGGRGEGGQQQRERERMQEKQKSRARKPQMTRQNSYTDKSGHLRPYDDDEEEEDDNEDTHNSDETDSEEGDAVDHNNGKRVNDSSRGNKATSGRLEKASKGGSSKSNGGREKQSSETNSKVPQPPPKLTKRREQNQSIPPLSNIDRQPFTGASSSKSKRKVAVPKDKNKQPTEIEIIDEVADDSKTNRQQKRKPKKSEQRKGSETSLTGPVPEIRVEDFSENGNSTGSSSNKDKGVNRDNVLKPNTKGGKPKVSPKQEGANKEQLNKKTDKDDRSRGAVRKLSFMFENKAGGNSSATPDVEGEEINTEVEVSPRSGEEESAGVEKNRATDDGSDVSENSYPSTSRDATRNAERDSETQGTSASKDNRPHDVDFGNRRKTRDRRARLSPGDEPSGPAADTDTDVLIDIGQDDEEDIAMATTPSGDPGVNSFRERSSSYGQYRRDRPSVISLGLAEEDVERLSTGGDDVTGRNPTPPGVSAHNAGTPLERKPEVERRSSNGGFAILAITNGNLDIDTEGELDIINNTERQNDNEEQGGGYTDSQTSNKNNPSTGRKILKATGFSNLLKKFQGK